MVSIMSSFRQKASIVTFIGPVGVGKSTQMGLARDFLETKGFRVVVTFIKSSHALTYLIEKPLFALGIYEKVVYGGNIRTYLRRDLFRRLLPLWCFLDVVSIAAKFMLTVYIPLTIGYTVFVEEGLAMTLLTYNRIFPFFFETSPQKLPVVTSLLAWTKSRKHVNVILDASDDELILRRSRREYRRNELPDYIRMQRQWMNSLDTKDSVFINTSGKTISEVQWKIVQLLEDLHTR